MVQYHHSSIPHAQNSFLTSESKYLVNIFFNFILLLFMGQESFQYRRIVIFTYIMLTKYFEIIKLNKNKKEIIN